MTTVEECSAITRLAQVKDHLMLADVSWDTYEAILDETEERRLRHTYDCGRLEIMTRSSVHEIYKSLLGTFVVTLADELDSRSFWEVS